MRQFRNASPVHRCSCVLLAAAALTFTAGCGECRVDCGGGIDWDVDGSVDSDDGGPAFNDATPFDVEVKDADAAEAAEAGDAGDSGDADSE